MIFGIVFGTLRTGNVKYQRDCGTLPKKRLSIVFEREGSAATEHRFQSQFKTEYLRDCGTLPKKRLSIVFEREGSAATGTGSKRNLKTEYQRDCGTLPKKRLSIVFEREGSAATEHRFQSQFKTEYLRDCGAAVAQGTHNPLVVGSNPSGPNFLCFCKIKKQSRLALSLSVIKQIVRFG